MTRSERQASNHIGPERYRQTTMATIWELCSRHDACMRNPAGRVDGPGSRLGDEGGCKPRHVQSVYGLYPGFRVAVWTRQDLWLQGPFGRALNNTSHELACVCTASYPFRLHPTTFATLTSVHNSLARVGKIRIRSLSHVTNKPNVQERYMEGLQGAGHGPLMAPKHPSRVELESRHPQSLQLPPFSIICPGCTFVTEACR